ncbi:MAG: Sua5 family C-terminal domain-containing protein, partial [Candidatus Paceibacterota bacterium]
ATVEWIESGAEKIDPDAYYLFHTDQTFQTTPNSFHYRGDFDSMARDLYDHFRTADHLSYSHIKIEPLPDAYKSSIISALMDRISKAIGS